MNDDNEAGHVSPNSAASQLAAYRLQRMQRSQIEEEDSEDEPQQPLLRDQDRGAGQAE